MKNFTLRQFSLAVLLLLLALPAAAYSSSPHQTPPSLRDSVEQTRSDLIEKRTDILRPLQLAARDEGINNQNSDHGIQTYSDLLIQAYSTRTAGRFNAAIMRLKILTERLMSRANKLRTQGDISGAEDKLTGATIKINAAQAATYRGLDHLEAISTSTAPTYELAQARTDLTSATTLLDQARDSLIIALQYLQVVAAGTKNATSSLPTSSSN
jgi:hypothetical protein